MCFTNLYRVAGVHFAVVGMLSSAMACDGGVAVKPTTRTITINVTEINAQAVDPKLDDALTLTEQHVNACHGEVVMQQKAVEEIKQQRNAITAAREESIPVLCELRNLLLVDGCSVCVEGKSYSKATIAAVVDSKLKSFAAQASQLATVDMELAAAQLELERLIVKANRWETAQKLLIAKIDRVLENEASERGKLAKHAAEREALQLADAITARIAKANAVANSATPSKAASEDTLSSQISSAVTNAIAEFEAVFGK